MHQVVDTGIRSNVASGKIIQFAILDDVVYASVGSCVSYDQVVEVPEIPLNRVRHGCARYKAKEDEGRSDHNDLEIEGSVNSESSQSTTD